MSNPSTDWHERIVDDEDARFARQSAAMAALHATKSARFGTGRLLHRKPLLAAHAIFEVFDDLPPEARHGVFATPGRHPALVRLSNGSFDVAANTKPDIRGFAIKVLGVTGPAALGGTTDHQDFLLINHENFSASTSDEFVGVVMAAAKGQIAVLVWMFRTYGVIGALARLKTLAAAIGKPFAGFAAETFNTVLPITIGPYAARLRVAPIAPMKADGRDIATDIADRLARGPIIYDVGLQFFVDEATTPIENPTIAWPEAQSPYVTVARLTLLDSTADVEGLRFDPWGGLADHRPLGEIMRARKAAYYLSQKGRGAAQTSFR